MNTIKSVYYGWATLIVAGGGAYYFAKKSINADRAAKASQDHAKRVAQYQLEQSHFSSSQTSAPPSARGLPKPSAQTPMQSAVASTPPSQNVGGGGVLERLREGEGRDGVENPSHESVDPAATRHEPENEAQKVREKSKYEASDVYRSRRGDRFS